MDTNDIISPKTFILIGPTKSGKSSIVNLIMNENVAQVDCGYMSCTQKNTNYIYKNIEIVDTVDFFDSRLNYTIDDLKSIIENIDHVPNIIFVYNKWSLSKLKSHYDKVKILSKSNFYTILCITGFDVGDINEADDLVNEVKEVFNNMFDQVLWIYSKNESGYLFQNDHNILRLSSQMKILKLLKNCPENQEITQYTFQNMLSDIYNYITSWIN